MLLLYLSTTYYIPCLCSYVSCDRYSMRVLMGHVGVKWRGLSQKLEAARSYAQSLPPDDVMLFTDAFDVMFTNTPLHIMNMYYELSSPGADIIFAGECGCWYA